MTTAQFRSGARRGQALVEFALVLPVLMLLLLGILEFGRAWNVRQVLTDAAREGARLAVVGDPSVVEESQVDARIAQYLGRARIDPDSVAITYEGFDGRTGDILTVELTLNYHFIALHRLAGLVTNDGVVTLRTAARMRIE